MNKNISIRKATVSDFERIAHIHAESWRNTYQNVLTESYLMEIVPHERNELWNTRLSKPKPTQKVFVAESNGQVVGFVCIYLDENPQWGSYLDNLHVLRDFRSNGIGQSLLKSAARVSLEESNSKGMCLLVNQDNVKAQKLYLSLGARNQEESVWQAPDNSVVPTFWFVWDDLNELIGETC